MAPPLERPSTDQRSPASLGVLFCVVAGILYGTLVILGKLAYTTGITPLPLLFLRYTLAAALMWAALAIIDRRMLNLPRKQRLVAIGLGLAYASQSYLYFVGFQTVDGAVTGLLFNTFPLHIALLAAIFLKEKLTREVVVALALGVGGVAITTRPAAGATDLSGPALILLSAFGYSCYVVAARKATADLPSEAVAAHVFLGAALGFTTGAIAAGQLPTSVRLDSLAYALALAVVATLLPILLFLKGLKRIGAARAGVIGTMEPLVTVLLAAVILGSVLGPFEVLGGAMIVVASLLIHRAGLRRPGEAPAELPRE